jgi:hypothetical protein
MVLGVLVKGVVWTYHPQTYPGLSKIDQQTVLGPSPCSRYFLDGQICAILLEVDLHDQSNSLDCNSSAYPFFFR